MIDLSRIPSPVIRAGDAVMAHRDPTVIYHDGVFRLFYSHVHLESNDTRYWYLGTIQSVDLIEWTEPKLLTPRDLNLNYSSPGNVVRLAEEWILCLQTYPTPNNELFATEEARIFVMRSRDLENWSEPERLALKGPGVPAEEMGRMIDPYLIEDKDKPGKWWCFYKQHGVSMSYSHDLTTWSYFGRTKCGENVCVLVDRDIDEYVVIHSPKNGVGMKRTSDLVHWRDVGVFTLGQKGWPWAQGRLTAGFVLDMRDQPEVGKFLLFFHGATPEGSAEWPSHGRASLGLAWSDDLVHWAWPNP